MASARDKHTLSHLRLLESEAIHIIREAAAEFDNPVVLYSIGKDSSVLARLIIKAFAPGPVPIPFLHVDTGWKFEQMYAFRERFARENNIRLIVHKNQEGVDAGVDPFSSGSQVHTDVMKTQGLKQALSKYGFDAAFGGARREEEKSRAKERIFSFRDEFHQWDPKNQRPELWNIYNGKIRKGQSVRVFPMSNWTELDIWQYIHIEQIPVVPLYFAEERPVVNYQGAMIMVDDERMPIPEGEEVRYETVRFRTLGCYPLTGAIRSSARTIPDIIREMMVTRLSERQNRLIDFDEDGSMERKKREGYF